MKESVRAQPDIPAVAVTQRYSSSPPHRTATREDRRLCVWRRAPCGPGSGGLGRPRWTRGARSVLGSLLSFAVQYRCAAQHIRNSMRPIVTVRSRRCRRTMERKDSGAEPVRHTVTSSLRRRA